MVLQLLPQLGSGDRQREEGQMTETPGQLDGMDERIVVNGVRYRKETDEDYNCVEILRYCDQNGEGTIALSQRFLDEPNLFKADVLQDWIGELAYEYNKILEEGLL
jgi:hypothetical protein